MKLKQFFLTLLFLSFVSCFSCFGQTDQKADSLKTLLKGESRDSVKANLYNLLADHYRQKDPLQHQIYALKAIQTSRAINYSFGLATGYNMYGQVFENSAGYETALLYYDSSMTKWKQMGQEKEEAHMLLNMANVYNRMGNYPTAADYTIRSLKKQEKLKNTFGVAVCKLTLGNIYYQQNDIDGALKSYEEAYAMNKASDKNADLEGAALGNIGAMFKQKENYDSAIYYIRLAAITFKKNGADLRLGSTYNNLGACFRSLKNYDSAMYYGRKGLELYKDGNRPEGVANALMALGTTEEILGNVDSALTFFSRGAIIAKQIGARDLESNFYSGLSAVYKKKNNFERSLYYLERYMNLDDSLHGEEATSSIEKLKKNYEIDKKNKAMLDVEESKALAEKNYKRNIIFFITGGFLLIGIIITIIILLRSKQKHNSFLEVKNDEISQQKEEITASITYARRIQQSVLPDERILQKSGLEYFILNKPRDIVSGDFYWLADKNGKTYVAVADCTGHGVPGALVSVIGVNILNKIIEQPGSPSPSEILELLHVMMIHALNKDADARDTNDGMDIALLCIDKNLSKVTYSGAGRPLYYHDATGMHSVKGNRYSIAGEKSEEDAPFTESEISFVNGTTFYMSSDGYADQFGENSGKKFLSKNFQDLLSKVSSLPISEQSKRIDEEFMKWKGNLEQVDDVLVVGVKI